MPDGGGILYQEREIEALEHGQNTAGVGADQVAHVCIEAVVDVCQSNIEMRQLSAHAADFCEPTLLHSFCDLSAKRQEPRNVLFLRFRLEEVEWIHSGLLAIFAAHILVHGCEPSGVRHALQRLEVQFGNVDAIPVETLD